MQSPAQARERKKGISGSTVKIIAITAMLIDHVAAAFLTRLLLDRGLYEIMYSDMEQQINWLMANGALYYATMGMRLIGRLGFPIFCFLLVEGFQKTRNVKKYAFRLGLFALISEIPFDLAFSGKVLEFGYQNVYFTLFFGMLSLCACDFLMKHELPAALQWLLTAAGILAPGAYFYSMGLQSGIFAMPQQVAVGIAVFLAVLMLGVFVFLAVKKGLPYARKRCAVVAAVVLAMLLADFLKTDYSGMGVLTIAVMYSFRKRKVICMLMGCIVLSLMSISEVPAFLTLIPVALYNGKRGLKMKYFFYAFYPAHLFIIWLITFFMGLGWISAI